MRRAARWLRGVRAFRTRASARAVQREYDREMRHAYQPPAWWAPVEAKREAGAMTAPDEPAAEATDHAWGARGAPAPQDGASDPARMDELVEGLVGGPVEGVVDGSADGLADGLVDGLEEARDAFAPIPAEAAADTHTHAHGAAACAPAIDALAAQLAEAARVETSGAAADDAVDTPAPSDVASAAAALAVGDGAAWPDAVPNASWLDTLAAEPEPGFGGAVSDEVLAHLAAEARGAPRAAHASAPPRAEPRVAPLRGVRDVYDWRGMAASQEDVGLHGRRASALLPRFDARAWVEARRWPTLSLRLRAAHAAVHKALRGQGTAPDVAADVRLAVGVREYQNQWRAALAHEREHTEAELAALRERPVAELEALGVAMQGLEAYWQTERHYGRRVAVFKLPGARRLPRHRLLPGAIVDVRPTHAAPDWFVPREAAPHRTLALVDRLMGRGAAAGRAAGDGAAGAHAAGDVPADGGAGAAAVRVPHIAGELVDCTPTQLRVRFGEAHEHLDWDAHGTWRLDRGESRVVDERTDAALDALLYDPDDTVRAGTPRRRYALVGTPLRAALLGGDAPRDGLFARDMLIRSWYERYAREDPLVLDGDPALGLNASQTRAVAMMLREPLSLVQGPPGTGKTRTLVQAVSLLKQHFRVPQPVLLAAHTNVAVDNLARACVARGMRVVRAGSSAAAHPALAEHTLEAHVARHPQHAQLVEAQHALRVAQAERARLEDEVRAAPHAPRAAGAPRDGALRRRLAECKRHVGRLVARCHMLRSEIAASVLHGADVVCATAVAAGSRQLETIDFPLVLVDEGSMATEPIALIALMKGCTQLAVIGDHQQLPPVLRSTEARRAGLSTSLFERLIHQGTPRAAGDAARRARVPSILLEEQFRMHPTLAAFPNAAFYGGALRDAPSTHARTPLASAYAARHADGTPRAVTLLTHAPVAPSAAAAGGGLLSSVSPYNAPQADLALALLCDLLAQNPTLRGEDIGIVTPYEAQVRLLERMLAAGAPAHAVGAERSEALPLLSEHAVQTLAATDPARSAQLAAVEVHTVDGFEGREKRVLLFSTVKAAGGAWSGTAALRAALAEPSAARLAPLAGVPSAEKGGYVGFLADTRRLNVALTRAQSQLFILGNLDTLLSARLGRSGAEAVEHSDVHAIRAYARWLLAQGAVLDVETVHDRLLAQAARLARL